MTKAKPKTDVKQAAKVDRLIARLPQVIGRDDPDLVAAIKGETPKKD